jgi:hypothetical protein
MKIGHKETFHTFCVCPSSEVVHVAWFAGLDLVEAIRIANRAVATGSCRRDVVLSQGVKVVDPWICGQDHGENHGPKQKHMDQFTNSLSSQQTCQARFGLLQIMSSFHDEILHARFGFLIFSDEKVEMIEMTTHQDEPNIAYTMVPS